MQTRIWYMEHTWTTVISDECLQCRRGSWTNNGWISISYGSIVNTSTLWTTALVWLDPSCSKRLLAILTICKVGLGSRSSHRRKMMTCRVPRPIITFLSIVLWIICMLAPSIIYSFICKVTTFRLILYLQLLLPCPGKICISSTAQMDDFVFFCLLSISITVLICIEAKISHL